MYGNEKKSKINSEKIESYSEARRKSMIIISWIKFDR